MSRLTATVLLTLALGTAAPAALAQQQVRVTTNVGSFVITLDEARAPLTVANFLQYIEKGHYPGTLFHRVPGAARR